MGEVVSDFEINDSLKCGLFLKKTDDWLRFGVAELCDKSDEGFADQKDWKNLRTLFDLAVTGMYVPRRLSVFRSINPSPEVNWKFLISILCMRKKSNLVDNYIFLLV